MDRAVRVMREKRARGIDISWVWDVGLRVQTRYRSTGAT
jgi:hypothetical protein